MFGLLLSLSSLTPSWAISVSEIPNPRQDNNWVMDMADLLSLNGEKNLNQMITALEKTNGAEIIIVTVPDTQSSASPQAFTTELFNTWGIGKTVHDNGVLVLVSKKDRHIEIETGYGIEVSLPNTKIENIIRTEVLPAFEQDDYETGIVNGTLAIAIGIEPEIVLPKVLNQQATTLRKTHITKERPPTTRKQAELKRRHNRLIAKQQRQVQVRKEQRQRLPIYKQLTIIGGLITLMGLSLLLFRARRRLHAEPFSTTRDLQENPLNRRGTLTIANLQLQSIDSITMCEMLAAMGLATMSAGLMGWVVVVLMRSVWFFFALPATVVGLIEAQSLLLHLVAQLFSQFQSNLCQRLNLKVISSRTAYPTTSAFQYVNVLALGLGILCLVLYTVPAQMSATDPNSTFAADVISAQLAVVFSLIVSLLCFKDLYPKKWTFSKSP
ncbi:YgcG family protein [Acaryochloris sp. IP29b_bin.148]|uniref:TPM domain-containing protein n=1 Tax=Acaryochloris sp. IP29b_bin.148 TaxID=2969218 RepID=UPI00262E9685|nr:TPM domain-containing protein [Acaryochloris sp. IP29b_bin.148]